MSNDDNKNPIDDTGDEPWFDDVYSSGSAEQSPAELDALILQSASQKSHRRWPMLATAAVLVLAAGILINAPDSALTPASQSEVSSIATEPASVNPSPGSQRDDAMPKALQRTDEPAAAVVTASPTQPPLDRNQGLADSQSNISGETAAGSVAEDVAALPAEAITPTAATDTPPPEISTPRMEPQSVAEPTEAPRLQERSRQLMAEIPQFESEKPTASAGAAADAANAADAADTEETYDQHELAIEEVVVASALKRAGNAPSALTSRGCPVSVFAIGENKEQSIELKQCSDGRWTLDPERKLCGRYLRVRSDELRIDGDTLRWANGDAIACLNDRLNRPEPIATD